MTKVVKCPMCGQSNICNVYTSKTYEYISFSLENDIDYSYDDNVEDFIHSKCDDCGAVFDRKIENFITEDEKCPLCSATGPVKL